ncbi:CAP domain-containing protein [Salicibibacter cibi]|nr:CAP domain-containing protein [Salicibibacter cibi]
MKKYLLALSAFLLVPAGAMAEEEDVRYIEGDDHRSIAVFGYAGSFNVSGEDWDTVEDKFEVISEELDLQSPEDVDEEQEDQDKPADETDEENEKEEGQPEEEPSEEEQPEQEQSEENNEEEGNDDEQEHGDGQVDEQDNEQNNDQNFETESEFEQEVVRLTNEEREDQGLQPLEAHSDLSDVARVKSEDMRDSDYFSHDSPNYGSPFDMMDEFGIDYMGAGENIAAGQQSPEQVVEGWMNSDGHRDNILNEDFTHIGIGHVAGGSYGDYWTQMFITE